MLHVSSPALARLIVGQGLDVLGKSLDKESKTLWLFQKIVFPRLLENGLRVIVCFEDVRHILKEILEGDAFRLLVEEKNEEVLKNGMTEATDDAIESDLMAFAFLKTPEVVEEAEADTVVARVTH